MTRRYGAGPFHLTGLLATLTVGGVAAAHWFDARGAAGVLLWFAGAIAVHDLVLLPVYSVLDRIGARRRRAAWVYVRVPALLSGMVGIVFLPEILRLGTESFHTASGLDQDVYLERWLAWTAVLFLVSGALHLVRRRRRTGGSE